MTKLIAKSALVKSFPISKKNYWIDLLYLFILMIVVVIVYNKVYDVKPFFSGDNVVYYITGKAIANGEGYTNINSPFNSPAITFPPGYPLISAGVMLIFGKQIEVMNKANGFFLFGCLIFLYLISIRFTKNKHLSFVITIITALNVYILQYSIISMSEIPFIFTSLGAIYFFIRMKKQSLPFKDINFWLFLFFLMFSYYIRIMGIVLIGGVVFYLLLERKWKLALIVFACLLLTASPWYLKNKSLKNHYAGIVRKNSLRPESGGMKTADWFSRIEKNAKRYVSIEIPFAMLGIVNDNLDETYKNPLPKDRKWFIGFLFIALGITGLFCVREYKWLMIFYLSGTTAILMLIPDVWFGIRFMLPVVPLLYMLAILALFDGISWLSEKINIHENIRVSFLPFIFLLFSFVLKDGIDYLGNISSKGIMPNGFSKDFELAKWAKENIPHNSVVVCRKPEFFYLYSDCKTTGFLYTLNADSLILNMKANKATHVVLDQIGFSQTRRYLLPAIIKNSEKFKLIKKLHNPESYLYEIHYENGYKGEMKDGKKNGKGIFRYADGTVYDGYWKNDLKEGKGIIIWSDGSKFDGVFSNNLRNGAGILYKMQNKQIIKATWINDSIYGYTRLYDYNGKLLYQGIVKNDKFVDAKRIFKN